MMKETLDKLQFKRREYSYAERAPEANVDKPPFQKKCTTHNHQRKYGVLCLIKILALHSSTSETETARLFRHRILSGAQQPGSPNTIKAGYL